MDKKQKMVLYVAVIIILFTACLVLLTPCKRDNYQNQNLVIVVPHDKKQNTELNNQGNNGQNATSTRSEEQNNMPGSDRDEHGCIGSAGYKWCAVKNKCLRLFEEDCGVPANFVSPCQKTEMYCPLTGVCRDFLDSNCIAGAYTDQDLIKLAYANKFSLNIDNYNLEMFFDDGIHAVAGIDDLTLNRRDGSVFAINNNGNWQIVAAGRSSILCSDIPADYPSALIPECADGKGNTVIR